jgi:hypothetical protein
MRAGLRRLIEGLSLILGLVWWKKLARPSPSTGREISTDGCRYQGFPGIVS